MHINKVKYVICKNCNWVHFGVTTKYVKQQNEEMTAYMKTLKPDIREKLYGFRKMKDYTPYDYYRCFRCSGPFWNMRRALKKEIPMGSTIQPVLHYNEI